MPEDCLGIKENGDPCDYTIWKDGYCRIHHPDRIDGVPDIETQDPPLTVRNLPVCPKCKKLKNVRIRRQGSGIISLVCSVCNSNFTG